MELLGAGKLNGVAIRETCRLGRPSPVLLKYAAPIGEVAEGVNQPKAGEQRPSLMTPKVTFGLEQGLDTVSGSFDQPYVAPGPAMGYDRSRAAIAGNQGLQS